MNTSKLVRKWNFNNLSEVLNEMGMKRNLVAVLEYYVKKVLKKKYCTLFSTDDFINATDRKYFGFRLNRYAKRLKKHRDEILERLKKSRLGKKGNTESDGDGGRGRRPQDDVPSVTSNNTTKETPKSATPPPTASSGNIGDSDEEKLKKKNHRPRIISNSNARKNDATVYLDDEGEELELVDNGIGGSLDTASFLKLSERARRQNAGNNVKKTIPKKRTPKERMAYIAGLAGANIEDLMRHKTVDDEDDKNTDSDEATDSLIEDAESDNNDNSDYGEIDTDDVVAEISLDDDDFSFI